jgi:hypothetical protein
MEDEAIPNWLQPGAQVEHTAFGRGEVLAHGEYKGHPVIRIRFAIGVKYLSKEFGIPQLSPAPQPVVSSLARLAGRLRRSKRP